MSLHGQAPVMKGPPEHCGSGWARGCADVPGTVSTPYLAGSPPHAWAVRRSVMVLGPRCAQGLSAPHSHQAVERSWLRGLWAARACAVTGPGAHSVLTAEFDSVMPLEVAFIETLRTVACP